MSETRKAQIIIEFDLRRETLGNGEALRMMTDMIDRGTLTVNDLRALQKVTNLKVSYELGE